MTRVRNVIVVPVNPDGTTAGPIQMQTTGFVLYFKNIRNETGHSPQIVYAPGLATPNASAQHNPFANAYVQPSPNGSAQTNPYPYMQPQPLNNGGMAQEYNKLGQFQTQTQTQSPKAFDIDYNELEGMTEIGRGYVCVVDMCSFSFPD